jgi:hypothetical protein
MRGMCISSSVLSATLVAFVALPGSAGVGRSGSDSLHLVHDRTPPDHDAGTVRSDQRLVPAEPSAPSEGSSTPPPSARAPTSNPNRPVTDREQRDQIMRFLLMQSVGSRPFGPMGH